MPRFLYLALPGLLLSLNAAGHDLPPVRDQVRLTASASREVETDLTVAVLYKEHQSQEQATAANEVNKAVSWGVEQAKQAGVPVRTEGYRSHPVYRNQRLAGWRVNQSLRLESDDAAKLAPVLGQLQSRLTIQSLRHVLSHERRTEVENELIREALEAFQDRARQVASTLSRAGHGIVSIDLSTGTDGAVPMRGHAVALQSKSVAEPTIGGGRERVSVQVSGTISLNTAP